MVSVGVKRLFALLILGVFTFVVLGTLNEAYTYEEALKKIDFDSINDNTILLYTQ